MNGGYSGAQKRWKSKHESGPNQCRIRAKMAVILSNQTVRQIACSAGIQGNWPATRAFKKIRDGLGEPGLG